MLPEGFVYLEDICPSIQQEQRYFYHHNFIGRPIRGYLAPRIILTEVCARALASIEETLRGYNLGLKVFDAYRPQQAVEDFYEWSLDPQDECMKAAYYPDLSKEELFSKGYISRRSTHSRGSTVDLTIIPLPLQKLPLWTPGDPLLDERLPQAERWPENSLDMGTGFDCFDELSHPMNKNIPTHAQANRLLLATLMEREGFKGISTEWWHFTLKSEPFPETYFDFPVL